MGGGLMQLIAYGAQDVYLTSENTHTFFSSDNNKPKKITKQTIIPDILYKTFRYYKHDNKFVLEPIGTNNKYLVDNLQDNMTINFDDYENLYCKINCMTGYNYIICCIETKNNNIIVETYRSDIFEYEHSEYKAKTINTSSIFIVPDNVILCKQYKNLGNELFYWNDKIYESNDLADFRLSLTDKISKVNTKSDNIIFKLKDKQYIVRDPIFTEVNISAIFERMSRDRIMVILRFNSHLEQIINKKIIYDMLYHYNAINLISDQDEKSCEISLKKYPRSINHIRKNINELALLAYKYNIKSIQYIKKREKIDENVLDIIFHNEKTIKYLPTNKNIEMKALSINGLALKHIKRQNEIKSLLAVRQNGLALQYVKYQNQNICDEAIKQNKDANKYIKPTKQFSIKQKKDVNYENIESVHSLFECI